MKKDILMLSALLVFSFSAFASNDCDDKNICIFDCAKTENDKCTATLDKTTNTLTLKGYGDIKDYAHSCSPYCHNTADWGEYSAQIHKVVLENESSDKTFNSIGNSAFEYMFSTEEVILPEGLTSISGAAFNDARALKKMNFPDSLSYIGGYALNGTLLEDIVLPKDIILEDASWTLGSVNLKSLTISGTTQITELMFTNSQDRALSDSVVIYCEDTNQSCKNLMNNENFASKIKFYQKYGDGYYYKGNFYKSPNDVYNKNYAKKRIYSVEEANKVSGNKNIFKIRYK